MSPRRVLQFHWAGIGTSRVPALGAIIETWRGAATRQETLGAYGWLGSSGTERDGAGALERLLAATAAEMEKVNALILTRARSHVEMVPQLARYLIEAGGKRLRPMLTVAAALLFGKPTGAQTNYAAAVEFMHNATLLHDDVVDESDMRRGRPAARKIWGNQAERARRRFPSRPGF